MSKLIKLVIWYIAGSVPFAFLTAAYRGYIEIIFNFATLTIGLTIGLLLKEQFLKRPWLIVFVPILYLIVGMFL